MQKKSKHRSLSAKTVRSTVQSCIVFGLIVQIVAVTFYAIDLARQFIKTTENTLWQTYSSLSFFAGITDLPESVIEVYNGLTEEQRMKVGTDEYRQFYSMFDFETEGNEYFIMKDQIEDALVYHYNNKDITDIYLASYDEKNSAIVYIIDPDIDDSYHFMPGDWEPIDPDEIQNICHHTGTGARYDIGYTQKYGFVCTVGIPVRNMDNEAVAYLLADIPLENYLTGMLLFSLEIIAAVIIITVIIAWIQVRHIKKTLVQPVNKIAEASASFVKSRGEGASASGHFASLDIHTGDEIEHLADTMSVMEQELKVYSDTLIRAAQEKERIGTELYLARRIQADMLPSTYPAFPDRTEFDVYATMDPAKEVGGDFYDYFLVDDDHLALVMADVSGKGIPAALFMMMSKILIQNFAMMSLPPDKVLEKANEIICRGNEEEMFVTVWLGVLEISTGMITAVNAGHEYPIIRTAKGDFTVFKDKHGMAVGGMPGIKYSTYQFRLEKGGTLFLYTDGIPEAVNSDDEMFGIQRLTETLNKHKGSMPVQLLPEIKAAVDEYSREAEQFDDLTMLGITLA